MNLSRILLSTAALGCAALLGAAVARGTSAPQEPGPPKAGAEHAALKKFVGKWDAVVSMAMAPGEPSEGTNVATAVGDFWVVSDFSSTIMGVPFTGHQVLGYDPAKKRFVSTWVDSMTTSMAVSEGTWDEATKSIAMIVDAKDMTGKPVKEKHVTEWKNDDLFVFHMIQPAEGGQEILTIEYKRRK